MWLSHFGRQRPRAAPPAVAPDEFEAFVARSFGGRLGLFHDSALMWWSGCDLRRAQLVDAAPWGSHSCAAAALRRRDEAGAAFVVLAISGASFLYHQVRSMVGAVVAVVRGARSEAWLGRVLLA